MRASTRPVIVAIGGTTRANSSSERVLRLAADRLADAGAIVEVFAGPSLDLPMYAPDVAQRNPAAQRLISAMQRANGFLLASPGYHGSVSGLIKNALDYAEDLRDAPAPYWDGRAVGLITAATGWQATGSTMAALRAVVHALRGWPTPMGVTLNTCTNQFAEDGRLIDLAVDRQLTILAEQVLSFATMKMLAASAAAGFSRDSVG
jgi:FMN reductase